MKTALIAMDMGDCVYSIQILRHLKYEKIILSDSGPNKFNLENAEFIKDVFESQDFIKQVSIHSKEDPLPDFDIDYGKHPQNFEVAVGTNLVDYHASKFEIPITASFFNEPWLDCKVKQSQENFLLKRKKLCISRSLRYRGTPKSPVFIKNILQCFNDEDITFVGIDEEYEDFKNLIGKDLNYYTAKSGQDLVEKINEHDVFVGNESLPCAIAKGLGLNCYVEIGVYAANYIFPHNEKIIYFK